ncbi:MAG: hypothetical protein ACLFQX_11985 [Candidatus Kapaibacterium sp.]
MSYKFTQSDYDVISDILGAKAREFEGGRAWHQKNKASGQSQVITLYSETQLGREIRGPLVSVQTQHGYFELHDCDSFIVFEPDEIIFISIVNDLVSCLIVGRECTCSLYSNIRRENLNADFATLEPAVLLSAMQLSLVEGVLP